jgi:hypothetical protein
LHDIGPAERAGSFSPLSIYFISKRGYMMRADERA